MSRIRRHRPAWPNATALSARAGGGKSFSSDMGKGFCFQREEGESMGPREWDTVAAIAMRMRRWLFWIGGLALATGALIGWLLA
jgi:hypothetical protein